MTVQKSDGWLGVITDPSAHAGCMKSVAEAISGPAGLLKNTPLLVQHKGGLGMGHHHIPGQELRCRRPELANRRKSKVDISAFPALCIGTAQAVSLLTPHQWDINASGRVSKRRGAKNLDVIPVFKGANEPKLALVGSMSASGPVMGHVNQSHPFQGKKFSVASVS
jgi:hypothetical protein